ncbi:MAG: hypothetical protein V1744_05475 [Candidatus Altiarchaeota archaeon]
MAKVIRVEGTHNKDNASDGNTPLVLFTGFGDVKSKSVLDLVSILGSKESHYRTPMILDELKRRALEFPVGVDPEALKPTTESLNALSAIVKYLNSGSIPPEMKRLALDDLVDIGKKGAVDEINAGAVDGIIQFLNSENDPELKVIAISRLGEVGRECPSSLLPAVVRGVVPQMKDPRLKGECYWQLSEMARCSSDLTRKNIEAIRDEPRNKTRLELMEKLFPRVSEK